MSEDLSLIVGLGNPGSEYERTRHNVGFRVVDVLASRLGEKLKPQKGIRALTATARAGGRRIVLAKPTTYMNLSGDAVAPLARYYKVEPASLVVVHDEADLPVGALRLKIGGGDGSHNGTQSVSRSLGTREYARVRLGVGRPSPGRELADWVLGAFSKAEEAEIAVVIEEAADAALMIVEQGLESAQNRYNGPRADEGV